MRRAWVLGLVAVVATISAGGVGFASFVSMTNLTFNDSAGTVNVVWVGPGSPSVAGTQPWDSCSVTLTASALTITVGNAAPGDGCSMLSTAGVFLENTGSIPASLTLANLLNSGPCTWVLGGSLGSFVFGSFPVPIAAGQSLPAPPPTGFTFTDVLASGQGDACMGGGAFTTTVWQISATAGS